METKPKDVYLATALGGACETLQTIVSAARNYGNCLTDNIYCTDYTARNSIIKKLCSAYYYHINCTTCFEPENDAMSEMAAVLNKTVEENVTALPLPIRDFLRKIETYGDETDGGRTLYNLAVAGVIVAADNATKVADGGDVDYTYKARLATAAMNVLAGMYNSGSLDRDNIYIGLRLVAIRLQEAIAAAVTEFVLSIYAGDATPAERACINPAAKLVAMNAAADEAKVLFFGFTGIDCRGTEVVWFDNDIQTTQAVDVINKAVDAESENAEALLNKLDDTIRALPSVYPEQTSDNIRKTLSILHKLSEALNGPAPRTTNAGV